MPMFQAALLTRMSHRPKWSIAAAAAASIDASSRWSSGRALARRPRSVTAAAVLSAPSVLPTYVSAMSQPWSARARQMAPPMSPDPPVTKATLSVSSIGPDAKWSSSVVGAGTVVRSRRRPGAGWRPQAALAAQTEAGCLVDQATRPASIGDAIAGGLDDSQMPEREPAQRDVGHRGALGGGVADGSGDGG